MSSYFFSFVPFFYCFSGVLFACFITVFFLYFFFQSKWKPHTRKMSALAQLEPPPPGYMRMTLVGSGSEKGVPVLGHFEERGCLCTEVFENPLSRDARLSAALLVTFQPLTSCADPTDADQTTLCDGDHQKTTFPTSTPATLFPFSPPLEKQKTSHNSFTSPLYNTLHDVHVHHILVDCGRMFRDAYFKVLLRENLRCLNALFLTSNSISSLGGLDDLRDLQSMSCELGVGEWCIHHFIPTFVLPHTLETLREKVPYILQNSLIMGSCPSNRRDYLAGWSEMKKKRAEEQAPKEWNNIGIRRSTALQLYAIPFSAPVKQEGGSVIKHVKNVANENRSGDRGEEEEESGDAPTRVYVDAFGPDVPVYTVPLGGPTNESRENTAGVWMGSSKRSSCFGLVFGQGTRLSSTSETFVKASMPPSRFSSSPSSFSPTLSSREETHGSTKGSCVAYLPYLRCEIPESSVAFLDRLERIDLLIFECPYGPLEKESSDPPVEKDVRGSDGVDHAGGTSLVREEVGEHVVVMQRILAMVRRWRPLHVVTTGMSCDIRGECPRRTDSKEEENEAFGEWGEKMCAWLRTKLAEEPIAREKEEEQGTENYAPIVSMGYDGFSVLLPV